MSKKVIKATAENHRLYEQKKRLAIESKVQKKLTKIRNALPDNASLATWGAGSRKFAEKIKGILEES